MGLGIARKTQGFLGVGILIIYAFCGMLAPTASHATGSPTLSGGSDVSGAPTVDIPIHDLSVTGSGNPTISVSLYVPSGTLAMTTTTGITFLNDVSSGQNLNLTGSLTNINNALATLFFNGSSLGTFTLEATLIGPGQVYNPINGHVYEIVSDLGGITATNAKTAADARSFSGVPGYLVTVTSSQENDYISQRLTGDGWMGASDAVVEGDWKWIDGPETGTSFYTGLGNFGGHTVDSMYANWSGGEPNDSGSNEDCGQFYVSGGTWNDLPCAGATLNGYVVEYGSDGDLPSVSNKSLTISVAADVVSVASCPELRTIAADPEHHQYDTINLTHNLDCAGDPFTPMFNSDFPFLGIFNGHNHSISDFEVDNESDDYSGLFGYADNASISNVRLISGSVNGQSYVGALIGYATDTGIDNVYSSLEVNSTGEYAGGLVGEIDNESSITDSHSTGHITSENSIAGGLVGYNEATISNSYATGDVEGTGDLGGFVGYNCGDVEKSFATGNITGTPGTSQRVGGFIGRNPCGTISESYATGDATGYSRVGGFFGAIGRDGGGNSHDTYARGSATGHDNIGGYAGRCGADILNSYSTGLVTGTIAGSSKGFVGATDGCSAVDSFWDTVTSGKGTSNGGTGQNTTQMTTESTFTDVDWDFADTWMIDGGTNDGYPILARVASLIADTDGDNDGLDDTVEADAPNSGDANDDGVDDSTQSNVTSFVDPVSDHYTVLESSCSTNVGVDISAESSLDTSDAGFDYPVGLQDFTIDCGAPGEIATITQYFYGNYDASKFVARKYDSVNHTFTTLTNATITNVTIDGLPALKVVYTIQDGSALDEDGTADGVIVDPAGPGQNVVGAPNTGLGRQLNW